MRDLISSYLRVQAAVPQHHPMGVFSHRSGTVTQFPYQPDGLQDTIKDEQWDCVPFMYEMVCMRICYTHARTQRFAPRCVNVGNYNVIIGTLCSEVFLISTMKVWTFCKVCLQLSASWNFQDIILEMTCQERVNFSTGLVLIDGPHSCYLYFLN